LRTERIGYRKTYRGLRTEIFKAHWNIEWHFHAVPMPFPYHAVPLIHTCHAAPLPCFNSAVSFVKFRVVAGNIRTASPTV
jgi:hypothetical protein